MATGTIRCPRSLKIRLLQKDVSGTAVNAHGWVDVKLDETLSPNHAGFIPRYAGHPGLFISNMYRDANDNHIMVTLTNVTASKITISSGQNVVMYELYYG